MKKSHSLKTNFICYFSALLIIMGIGMFIFSYFSVMSYQKQLLKINEAALAAYQYELEYEMTSLKSFNEDIFSRNMDFQMLSLDSISPIQQLHSTNSLRTMLKNKVPNSGAIYIYDKTKNIFICSYGQEYANSLECIPIDKIVKPYLTKLTSNELYSWRVITQDNYSLLVNTYKLKDTCICSMINLGKLIAPEFQSNKNEGLQFAFFSRDRILTNTQATAKMGITITKILKSKPKLFFNMSSYIIQTSMIKNSGIGIYSFMPLKTIWLYSKISLLMISAFFLIIICSIIRVYLQISKILLYPLRKIAEETEKLYSGNTDPYPKENSSIEELQKISDALDHMLIQRKLLEDENFRREREKEHAVLQYYQLQTKPHFFLNCLKSLYNMLENQDYEKMKLMIFSFSGHLRYVFHDNLKLVTLKEELAEVNDYYNILLLDREVPFLLAQDVDDQLVQYKVPPLIIQTFLENTFKYANPQGKTIKFSIKIDRIMIEDVPFIRIKLSDNGIGYSKEFLEVLNSEENSTYDYTHVGIINLKERIHLIYKSGYHLAFYNDISGGACSVILLPMKSEFF